MFLYFLNGFHIAKNKKKISPSFHIVSKNGKNDESSLSCESLEMHKTDHVSCYWST